MRKLGGQSVESDVRAMRIVMPRFVPLTTPLTSTSWNGDGYSTTAKTKIDLSAVFGAPAGVKAVLCVLGIRDSAASGTDCYIILGPTATADVGCAMSCLPADNRWQRGTLLVPCDSAGDIYYQTAASGAGTLAVWLEIWGYVL